MHANEKPFILGLTGGIACGKSTVAARLAELGAIHLDADKISHELLETGGAAVEPIRALFGDGAIREDGSVDRRRVGAIVFEDVGARRALEGIVHPLVQRRIVEGIDSSPAGSVVVMDVPLLFETGMDTMCDEVWVVTVEPEKQLERIMQRDGLDADSASRRIASQLPSKEKTDRADVVIHTDKTMERTLAEISQMYHALLRRIREK